MRYQMTQKLLALGDDYRVLDENGKEAYVVDDKILSLGSNVAILDLAGHELVRIRQKLLSWGPTYEITREGQPFAMIKKSLFTPFHCKFSIDVPGPDDLEARGDFTDHEYEITLGNRAVARVSKKWIALRDTYAIDVEAGQDDVLMIACAVVIDLACHDEGKE